MGAVKISSVRSGVIFGTILMLTSHVCCTNDGLYVSNGTHILYLEEDQESSTGLSLLPNIVYGKENGRIIGLAIDIAHDLIFWSDISQGQHGIYKASLNDGSLLQDVQKVIDSDIVEVNGLAVDWESQNIYWTDGKKRTIEVCDYLGIHRRVLSITGLLGPRGIYSDPVSGYIFWDDQIAKTISRARPDGSGQEVIISSGVILPNQLLVFRSKLYWVDANDQDVWRSDIDGSSVQKLGSVSSLTLASSIFGIAINADGRIYVSAWQRGEVVAFSVGDQNEMKLASVVPYRIGTMLFSMAYYEQKNLVQPKASNPCDPLQRRNGCSHICLPTSATSSRCSCPSYGGLTLKPDGKNCAAPRNVLVFALAERGEVMYMDTDNLDNPDKYLVGRSLRPVAVGYDSVDQMVYWSDVHERRIHKAKLDGSDHTIFLSMKDGLGVVDGLTVDVKNRKLYYTNIGFVTNSGTPYSWHKIEVISLTGGPIRTIVTDAEKPRGLWVDSDKGNLYYTDWGSQAKVVRTELDGSSPVILQKDLENPNSVIVNNGQVFVLDSHYKSQQTSNTRQHRNGSIARLSDAQRWEEWNLPYLKTPFGLAVSMGKSVSSSKFYVTDWDTNSIMSIQFDGNQWIGPETVASGLDTPMGAVHSIVSTSFSGWQQCESRDVDCDDVCFSGSNRDQTTCACSSYDAEVLWSNQQACQVPSEFLMFADMMSIKLIGYDTPDRSTYNLVIGQENLNNYVALAYDNDDQTIYYSDVSGRNTRGIYSRKLDGTQEQKIYQGNSIIDGLTLDTVHKKLYWTDYLAGEIVTIATSGDLSTKKTLIRALDSPRAIHIDSTNGYLYWTEWGDKPRVVRVSLADSRYYETLVSNGLKHPNGLSLDVNSGKMYIGDGFYKKILECDLDGSNCIDLPYVMSVPQHIFDVFKLGDVLFYSDWIKGSITQINMKTGQVSYIAQKLMRPTKIIGHFTMKKTCASENPCKSGCMVVPGGHECLCDIQHTLSDDQITCTPSNGWKPAESQQCGAPCGVNAVCSQQVGGNSVVYRCQCSPGYFLQTLGGEPTCSACPQNTYKPTLGNGDRSDCMRCATGSGQTPPASAQCSCPNGSYWNTEKKKCTDSKPGLCPVINSAKFTCRERGCRIDRDCSGAQKCCDSVSRCRTPQCVDPEYLSNACSYQGQVYDVGTVLPSSDPCLSCHCLFQGSSVSVHCLDTETCPILLCEDQISLPGTCCKTCSHSRKSPENITIENCPQGQTLTLELTEDDQRYGIDPTRILALDISGLDRSINVTKVPPGVIYEWTGGAVDVTWTAAAPQVTGPWDVDVCSYSVLVKDDIGPDLTCPEDIHVYTHQDKVRVKWLPPRSTDNVGLAPGYPKVTESQNWGSEFSIGEHKIVYTSQDLAHNTNLCTFQVVVRKLSSARCEVVSPHHGRFSCVDTGHGRVACQLKCSTQTGHIMNPKYGDVYQFVCIQEQWTPALPDNYLVEACIELADETVTISREFKFESCIPGLDVAEANADLKSRLHGLIPKIVQIEVEFSPSCDADNAQKGKKHLAVKVSLTQSYRTETGRDNVTQKLKDALNQTGDVQLIRPIIMGSHLYTTQDTTIVPHSQGEVTVKHGCLHGQITSRGCMVCPEGMYRNGGGVCKPCAENTYTSQLNQQECRPCNNNTVSPAASYTSLLCRSCLLDDCHDSLHSPEKPEANVMIIAIIVAVTAIVIIVIIVVMVIVIRNRRRVPKVKSADQSRDLSFTNPVFGNSVSENPDGIAPNNNDKSTKKKTMDKGSVRSTGSTTSAMARAFSHMPDKEIELHIDNSVKVIDHAENPYF